MLGTSSFRGQDVSAPQTTPGPGPERCKEESSKNGFVRSVAVSSIFQPANESDVPSKKPVVPEKRRFSALIGDLTPCSNGSSGVPPSDDFARRRQSWDTRTTAPFGQNLLRKTPRTKTLPPAVTEKSEPTKEKDDSLITSSSKPAINGCASSSDAPTSLRGQEVPNGSSENKDYKDSKQISQNQRASRSERKVVESTVKSVDKESDSAAFKSPLSTKSTVSETRSECSETSSVRSRGTVETKVTKGYHVSKLISGIVSSEAPTDEKSIKQDFHISKSSTCEQQTTAVETNTRDSTSAKGGITYRKRVPAIDTGQKDQNNCASSSKLSSVSSNQNSSSSSNDKSLQSNSECTQSTNPDPNVRTRTRVYGLTRSRAEEGQVAKSDDADKFPDKLVATIPVESVPESSQKRSRVYGVSKRELQSEKVVEQSVTTGVKTGTSSVTTTVITGTSSVTTAVITGTSSVTTTAKTETSTVTTARKIETSTSSKSLNSESISKPSSEVSKLVNRSATTREAELKGETKSPVSSISVGSGVRSNSSRDTESVQKETIDRSAAVPDAGARKPSQTLLVRSRTSGVSGSNVQKIETTDPVTSSERTNEEGASKQSSISIASTKSVSVSLRRTKDALTSSDNSDKAKSSTIKDCDVSRVKLKESSHNKTVTTEESTNKESIPRQSAVSVENLNSSSVDKKSEKGVPSPSDKGKTTLSESSPTKIKTKDSTYTKTLPAGEYSDKENTQKQISPLNLKSVSTDQKSGKEVPVPSGKSEASAVVENSLSKFKTKDTITKKTVSSTECINNEALSKKSSTSVANIQPVSVDLKSEKEVSAPFDKGKTTVSESNLIKVKTKETVYNKAEPSGEHNNKETIQKQSATSVSLKLVEQKTGKVVSASSDKLQVSTVTEGSLAKDKPIESTKTTHDKIVSPRECVNKEITKPPDEKPLPVANTKSPDLKSAKEYPAKTDSSIKEVPLERKELAPTVKQDSQTPESKIATQASTNKIEELPKNVRMARRTSDLIASKIQNIFSKVSTESKEPPKPLSKKSEKTPAGKPSEQKNVELPSSEVTKEIKEAEKTSIVHKSSGDAVAFDTLSAKSEKQVKEQEKICSQSETKAVETTTVSKASSSDVTKSPVEKPLPDTSKLTIATGQTCTESSGKVLMKAKTQESPGLAKTQESPGLAKTQESPGLAKTQESAGLAKSGEEKVISARAELCKSSGAIPKSVGYSVFPSTKSVTASQSSAVENVTVSLKAPLPKAEGVCRASTDLPSKNEVLSRSVKPRTDSVNGVGKTDVVSNEVTKPANKLGDAGTIKSEASLIGQSKIAEGSVSIGASSLVSKDPSTSQFSLKEKYLTGGNKSASVTVTDAFKDSKKLPSEAYEIEDGGESFKFYLRAKNLEDAKSSTDFKRHSSYVMSSASCLDMAKPSWSISKDSSTSDIMPSGSSDSPRPPERKRPSALRDPSLPPSIPPHNALITRTGSLKRFDDPKTALDRSSAVLRSPSHSCVPSYSPQRYSYTEMLSKVCSYGITPSPSATSFSLPAKYKKYNVGSLSQVSELWSDLNQEQSSAAHTSEILEAETTERMRLEKEVQELQSRFSHVQQKSDKMEMEMMEARVYRSSGVNGDLSDDEEAAGDGSIYKQKYERAVRDMEIMKRRIQQQHEEEVEQSLLNKKAADKKLAEALEDVEEERQVANQWKRKAQKLSSELQDIKLMLEEQMARNGELEKKQRKFDSELNASQEEIKKERLLREKLCRERDQALHEKYSLEQDLHTTRLDVDMQHEKITQLNRELDELTLSSKGEEEVTQLKRAKQELERKSRDQEEELEELAGQVQMLEQAKLRLEMSLEKLRQEHRRENSVREEEIEELRASFTKKVKNLEAQLESEQEDRHQLVKQKHELERRLIELTDQPPPQDPEIERRLRRDLKRTKALLRDAQSMLEHMRDGQGNKSIIRQLKNQLEDAEFAKCAAIKAKQAAEMELQDLQSQFEEVARTKNDAESRCLQLSREKSAIQTQLEEMEEELSEVMKKYKAAVAQMSLDQKTISEQNQQITELEVERHALKEQLSEVNTKFEHLAGQSEDTMKVHRLDGKVRELESKLELEQTTRGRLEHQIARLKEQIERLQEECDGLRNKENQAQEGIRRFQRQIRELREDYAALQQKEADAYRKQHELETALENAESDLKVTKNDLRLACQRIEELKNALEDDLDSGTDVPDDSGSDSDSSLDMSVLRHSLTPIQRCDSVSSDLSFGGRRSTTPSMGYEFSAMCSRSDAQTELNGFPHVEDSKLLSPGSSCGQENLDV